VPLAGMMALHAMASRSTAATRASKWRYLRFTPFDTSTSEGRAAERYRSAAWGALANVLARACGMLTLTLAVYWAAPILGPERFGLWAMFASLAAALSFLDLGVGNALINRIAHAEAAGERSLIRGLVSGGVGWLAVTGLASTMILLAINAMIPWGHLLHLSSPQVATEARWTGYAFSTIFGIHMLASGALKILIGQQRSYEAHLAAAAGALLAAAVLWISMSAHISVPELLMKTFGIPTLGGLAALVMLKGRGLVDLRGIRRHMTLHGPALLRTGGLFLLLQVATMIGWGLDTLILGTISGAAAVAAFAVAQRLFQFASQPAAVLLAPLWAAYADAVANRDHHFVRATLVRSMVTSTAVGAALTLALLLAGPWLVEQWTRGSIEVPTSLLVAMAAWTLLEIIGTSFAMYLNGSGIVREQVVTATAFCCVALPTKIIATQHFGATGIVAATVVAYVLVVVGLYTTVFRARVLLPIQGGG
jgi:O-antigen/teichoic acid export membrane protein